MYREQAKSVYRKLMFADFQWKHEREYIPNVNNDYFIKWRFVCVDTDATLSKT